MDARVCVLTLYSQPSLNAVCTVWFHESVGNGSWQLTSLLAFVFTRWARVVMILQKKMDLTCHNAELCSLCLHIMSEVWFGSLTWWFFLFCNVRFCLLDVYLFFFYIYLPPAPSASLVMIQRARSSTLRSTASTSWASTCQSTWASWWRRTRMLTRSSSPASSRMASPPIRQVLFVLFCKPSVGRWCYDLACVLSSRRLVCLYIMWQPGPKVIFWCVFLYLPLCELIGLLAKSFKLWAISH